MRPETRADHLADHGLERTMLRLFGVGSMTFFLVVCSQIAIPTHPLGIPVSLQSLAVVLAAVTLGPRFGLLSVLIYVGIGAMGAKVFAENEGGWITIAGQTGGYILGFIVCQPVIGWIVRRKARAIRDDDGTVRRVPGSVRGFWAILLAAVVAHAIIFAIGVPWLYWVRVLDDQAETLSVGQALYHGMVVFLPGMVLKSALAAFIGVRIAPACAERVW